MELYHEFFSDEFIIEDEAKAFLLENSDTLQTIIAFKDTLETSSFEPEALKDEIKAVGKAVGVKGKLLFMPVRIATTGAMHGPELPVALSLLGKEKVVNRIEQTIILMEANQ